MKDQLLRFTAVHQAVGLSRSTVFRLERAGHFPKRRQLSANSVGWMSSEIEQWVATRKQVAQMARES